MTFTKSQVADELAAMTLPGSRSFIPRSLADQLASNHDESVEYWTLECAGDEIYHQHFSIAA